jgi:putative toxin-antitoxin system antitoxin component (TIGR02293 family)
MARRLTRIERIAHEVFGDPSSSDAWLRETNGALGGRTPVSLLDTEEGTRLVEALLGRIAHGIVE